MRSRLFEFEDLPIFPAALRDILTGHLRILQRVFRPYAAIVPMLGRFIEECGEYRIVDLCSGSGPSKEITEEIRARRPDLRLTVTDKFPPKQLYRRLSAEIPWLDAELCSIDARRVPKRLSGLRTLFTAFHHFDSRSAARILENAVREKQAIAIFEVTGRSLLQYIQVVISSFAVLVTVPFIRPFSWKNLFWVYLIPLAPIFILWDGLVSNQRTYSVPELESLIEPHRGEYSWSYGIVPSRWITQITYLFGKPRSGCQNS